MDPLRIRRGIAFCVVLAALAAANYFGWRDWQRTHGPAAPLTAAIEAIASHDSATFEQAIDVDRLVGSYYDQRLARGNPVDEKTRTLYVKAIGRRLRHWIDSGEVEPSSPHFDALIEYLRDAVTRSPRITKPEKHGRNRFAAVILHNAAGDAMTLRLKLVQSDGRWRVAELLNAEEMAQAVLAAERHRLVRLVTLSAPRNVGNGAWELTVTSRSPSAIQRMTGSVTAGGATQTVEMLAAPLAPGESRTLHFDAAASPAVTVTRLTVGGRELPLPLD